MLLAVIIIINFDCRDNIWVYFIAAGHGDGSAQAETHRQREGPHEAQAVHRRLRPGGLTPESAALNRTYTKLICDKVTFKQLSIC